MAHQDITVSMGKSEIQYINSHTILQSMMFAVQYIITATYNIILFKKYTMVEAQYINAAAYIITGDEQSIITL